MRWVSLLERVETATEALHFALGDAQFLKDIINASFDAEAHVIVYLFFFIPFLPAQMPKIVLITGASSGIGEAAAKFFAANGFTTYVTARKTASLATLLPLGCRPLALDVTDEASMQACIATILAETGTIDVLVNNAGYGQNGVVEELPMDALRKQFETNVFGLLRMCQLVLPTMRANHSGRIINIGSAGGDFTAPGASAYHATKYALEAFTDGLRAEVRAFGVEVSLVKPGGVWTEFTTAMNDTYPAPMPDSPYLAFREGFKKMTDTMFARDSRAGILTPEQVAAAIYRAATAPHPHTRYRVGIFAKVAPRIFGMIPDRLRDTMFLSSIVPKSK